MTSPARTLTPVPEGTHGHPGNVRAIYTAQGKTAYAPAPADANYDLQFPHSVPTYELMRRTDSRIREVIRVVSLPILDAGWTLTTTGVRPEVERLVRRELGFPKPGETLAPRPRGAAGVDLTSHLREAMLCLPFGFSVFEQQAEITLPGDPGHPDDEPGPVVSLRKLAARLPSTIRRIDVDREGSLLGVTQYPAGQCGAPAGWITGNGVGLNDVTIDVDRLVVYCPEKEGGDWYGTSILRAAYRDWLIKDGVTRINAQVVERNGMGVPIITFAEEAHRAEAERLVRDFRAGATAGLALPVGMTAQLMGVTGSTVNPIDTIKHHNQEITKAVMAEFLDLGHDNGARSLGDVFVANFVRSLNDLSGQIAITCTEHVIRDLVEWNYGVGEPYPRLTPGRITPEGALTPEGMKLFAEAGYIKPDPALEAWVREQYHLPEADPDTEPVTPDPVEDPTTDPFAPDAGDPGDAPDPGQPVAVPVQSSGASLSGYAAWLRSRIGR